LGGHCHGLPFGTTTAGQQIATVSHHIDWPLYSLIGPNGSGNARANTCLLVLLLFLAYPELERICAQNRGGESWFDGNARGTVGVGADEDGMGAIFCNSIEEQTRLRALCVQSMPDYVFTSDVDSLVTFADHRRKKRSDKAQAVEVVKAELRNP